MNIFLDLLRSRMCDALADHCWGVSLAAPWDLGPLSQPELAAALAPWVVSVDSDRVVRVVDLQAKRTVKKYHLV